MKHLSILLLTFVITMVLTTCDKPEYTDVINNEVKLQSSIKEEIILAPKESMETSSENLSTYYESNISENEVLKSDSPDNTQKSSSIISSTSSSLSNSIISDSSSISSSSESYSISYSESISQKDSDKSDETMAVWISYLEYQNILTGKNKSTFRNNIVNVLKNLANDGFNTVYVHARSHSDAYYDSDIFPCSVYCSGEEGKDIDYDPLAIMVEEAHNLGLSIEAWINPYRIKGTTDTSKIAESNPAYKWLDTDKVIVVDGKGIFYNPADESVIELIVAGVEEIVRNYDIDGIHFDDYFYPTASEAFDRSYYQDYKKSGGKLELASWRRQNVNILVKKVYSAIKSIDANCRFGISPTGNTNMNYNELYCDVITWVTNNGYIDYICPQLYYGFKNESQPYLTVLDKFDKMITNENIELIVGLAAYKIDVQDNYAGSGKNEWQNNSDILSRQVIAARNSKHYNGFSLYRYDSIYNPSKSVSEYVKKEKSNLIDIM